MSEWRWESDGVSCAIIPRTIGGPCTVLAAEQFDKGPEEVEIALLKAICQGANAWRISTWSF